VLDNIFDKKNKTDLDYFVEFMKKKILEIFLK